MVAITESDADELWILESDARSINFTTHGQIEGLIWRHGLRYSGSAADGRWRFDNSAREDS